MTEFSLKKENFTIVLKQILPLTIIRVLIPVIIYFAVISNLKDSPLSGLLITIFAAMFLYNVISAVRQIFKIRKDWTSFKIVTTHDSIIKSQIKTPTITIEHQEISRVIEVTGGLSVQTMNPQKFIFIPSGIDKYEQLKSELMKIQPLETSLLPSVAVPAQFALIQHSKPNNTLKKLLIGMGITFGVFLGFILLIVGLIYFLSN